MCCDICLRLVDYNSGNSIICGRTMEFAETLKSKICIIPLNTKFYSNKLEWFNEFGFVCIKILNTDIIVDGMNDKGLSCGILVMDDTIYPSISKQSIAITDICSYILGTCGTTTDAINVLNSVDIMGVTIPVINKILGLHIVIHDRNGVSIVCEINNRNEIYYTDGVVTNGPIYPSQLIMREEYFRTKICKFHSSSVERFIKLSELKRICLPESYDDKGIIQLICRMFNTVDIIRGVSESIRDYGIIYGTTQWIFIKDLTSKMIYYRSQNDMTLRRINLNKINFTGTIHYSDISMDDTEPTIIDLI